MTRDRISDDEILFAQQHCGIVLYCIACGTPLKTAFIEGIRRCEDCDAGPLCEECYEQHIC